MSEDTTPRPKTAVEELAELEAADAAEALAAKAGKAEADARQEIANKKIIKELRTRIPTPIHRLDTDAGMVVIKRVSEIQYKHFFTLVLDEEQRASANEVLAAAAIVHPDSDTWDKYRRDFPALLASVSKAVIQFNGGSIKEKKL